MPFCTQCGHKNPDDARFCSQCGTRLETAAATSEPQTTAIAQPVPPVAGEPTGESTATINLGDPKTETGDRLLNPVDAAAVDALPSGHALLVVQRGPGAGSRFLLDQDVVRAGRNPDCEIFLDDVTVSRNHAEFRRTGDTFTVTDAGSLNGTYVNRDRSDTVQLTDADEVQIGKYRLVFFSGHERMTPGGPVPGRAATGDPGSGGRDRMNIGQVLGLLRVDFPSVSIPKLRFLEEKGLVAPERTPTGYRKFSSADVERLRYVLVLQRDHHQPLARIAEILDAIDRGLEPPPLVDLTPRVPEVALAADGLPSADSFRRYDDVRLSRRELLKLAGIEEPLLDQLEQYGLVAPLPGPSRAGSRQYPPEALVIATTARELAEFGLEPRHLRAFKTAADREVGLVEQVVAPHRRASDAAARGRTEDVVSQLAALSVRLHATLVKAGLRPS